MAEAVAARRAALDILRGVRQGMTFDDARLGPLTDLADADRRLAYEVAAGVLRSRRLLDETLAPLVSDRWNRTPADLQDILRIGLYQLTALDRVPAYAAVSATVDLAKASAGAPAARFVNAVLRRVSGQGAIDNSGAAAHAPAAADLATTHSHPDWLVARWLDRFGYDNTLALLQHNNRRPRVIVQPARWSLSVLKAAFAAGNVAFEEMPEGGLAVPRGKVTALPGFDEGGFIVQDSAQARLLAYAAFPENETVWDACAAPGGKTVALGRRGPVLSSDRTRQRVALLNDTVSRAAPRAIPLFVADATQAPIRNQSVPAVLLDAPCTATGTMARHPDARWHLTPERIDALVRRQKVLLDGIAPVIAPGGLLAYLTCSLEPEENADQVDAFLDRHPSFRREGADLTILPFETGTDGGYAARLRQAA